MSAEDVPEFVTEQLVELEPSTLRSLADYAVDEDFNMPDDAPQSLLTSLALQDDDTLDSIASLSRDLADRKERDEPIRTHT